jgi:hypothetical protein
MSKLGQDTIYSDRSFVIVRSVLRMRHRLLQFKIYNHRLSFVAVKPVALKPHPEIRLRGLCEIKGSLCPLPDSSQG